MFKKIQGKYPPKEVYTSCVKDYKELKPANSLKHIKCYKQERHTLQPCNISIMKEVQYCNIHSTQITA